jgi:hypothetical protein
MEWRKMIDWISLSTGDVSLAMHAYKGMVENGVKGIYYRRHFGTSVLNFTGRFWAGVEENRGLARIHGIRLQGFKVTRVDFAWDMPGSWTGVARAELLGSITTILSPTGVTLYSGSHESVRYLRVYDKRAEIRARTGVDMGLDLTRVELETKRQVARDYLALYEHGRGGEITEDTKTRYGLSFLAGDSGKRICVAGPDAGNPLEFCMRFYKVIGKAILADPKLFVHALELDGKVAIVVSPPNGST